MLRWFYLLMIVALISCQPKEYWRETDQFPTGKPRIMQRYVIDNGDTVITGLKVLYENGNVFQEGDVKDNEKHGVWKSYYEDGKPWSETRFKDGLADGPSKTWYKNGQLRYTGYFKAGEKSGTWMWYDVNGKLNKKVELGN